MYKNCTLTDNSDNNKREQQGTRLLLKTNSQPSKTHYCTTTAKIVYIRVRKRTTGK